MNAGERLFLLLLRLYPREFRTAYRDDLLAFFREDRGHLTHGAGPLRPIRFWIATLVDLVRSVWRARIGRAGVAAGSPAPRFTPGARLHTDVRYAWRALKASRGVTLSALAVLTLGIGASTTIFSVVDAVVLRGLPFDEPNRLLSVAEVDLTDGSPSTVAPQNYFEWLARQSAFETMGASANARFVLAEGDRAGETLRVVRITASLFDLLRVSPAIGRRFTERDEVTGAPNVALISDAFWRTRFHADPAAIGRPVVFETGTFTVIGVMPNGFTYPLGSPMVSRVDLWIPYVPGPNDRVRTPGRNYFLTVVGRLRPGATLEQASSQFLQIRDALAGEHPRWFADHGIVVRPLESSVIGPRTRAWMMLLLAAVGVVLVIACLNVANLLLARAAGRGREVALRSALGASRWDIARGLLVESLMLSLAGGACGVLFAFWGVDVLRSVLPENVPRLAEVSVDGRVLATAVTAAIGTGLLFGIVPALHASRPGVALALREGGRAQTSHNGERLRGALVVVEVALAVVLLAGSALFVASFLRVVRVDLGLDTDRVLMMSVVRGGSALLRAGGTQDDRVMRDQTMMLDARDRVRGVPGVQAVAVKAGGAPLSGSYMTVPVQLPDRTAPAFTGDDELMLHAVTPEYLDVLRLRFRRGRWFDARDARGAAPVIVLSDDAVRRYFGSADPLGRAILLDDTPYSVVGVVGNVRHTGPEVDVRAEGYIPYAQSNQGSATLVMRTTADEPFSLVPAVQAAVREVVPNARFLEPQTVDQQFARLVAQRKFNMAVLAIFGALALAIAAVGVYGLMAFLVAQRTREIGVRIALGAVPAGILRLVLRRASLLLLSGLLLGLTSAALLERLVRAFLYNAPPHDPRVYVAVACLLFGAGLVAALVPARRAARVDPLVALRAE